MEISSRMKNLLNTMNLIMNDKIPERDINYWEWNSGVGLFGVSEAYERTNDADYIKFIREWFDKNGGDDRYRGSVNCVIPCYAALTLYRADRDERCLSVCDEYADWAQNVSIKTKNGGIAHVWSIGGIEDYKNQLWADSVFMAGMFLILYAMETGNENLLNFAENQVKIHIESLYDGECELFCHGYHAVLNKRLGGHWGRGNGWIAAALAKILATGAYKGKNSVFEKSFVGLMQRAYSLKCDDGMLRTLLDEEQSYKEATASMLFGYAASVGCEIGLLDKTFLKWSEDILTALEFNDDGTVKYCSGGTDCFLDNKKYFDVPYIKSNYADGITLMFLSRFI